MSSTASEHAAAMISALTSSPQLSGCGGARRAPTTEAPSFNKSSRTKPAFSSKIIGSFTVPPTRSLSFAKTYAVPIFGCPANGNSARGVKMRTCAVCARSCGGSTKVVSARLNSPAIACICVPVSAVASGTTANGLPPNLRSVKTSTVTKAICIALAPRPAAAAWAVIGDAEMGFECKAVAGERGAVGDMNHRTAFDDDGAIGDAENFLGVLLDQDRRHAFLADDAAQRRQQFLDDDRRQPLQRLVEQHDARIKHQRATDREHLLLATGKLVAEILPPLGKPREQRVDLGDGPAARPRHRGEVLLDGERFEDVALLGHPANSGMGALIGAKCGDVNAIERDATAEIPRHADNGVDQRGLAHAVATQ